MDEIIKKPESVEDFVAWGKDYVKDKKRHSSPLWTRIRKSIYDVLLTLGVSEQVLKDVFEDNPQEVLETLLGEIVAAFALVFAWKKSDKLAFSQALGQIGIGSLFALNPLTAMIALAGLAIGYQKMIHPESVKKGGLLSLVGISVTAVFPGGLVFSFLAAVAAVIWVNKKISIDRPIEHQLGEIFSAVRGRSTEEWKVKTRKIWSHFEATVHMASEKVLGHLKNRKNI